MKTPTLISIIILLLALIGLFIFNIIIPSINSTKIACVSTDCVSDDIIVLARYDTVNNQIVLNQEYNFTEKELSRTIKHEVCHSKQRKDLTCDDKFIIFLDEVECYILEKF